MNPSHLKHSPPRMSPPRLAALSGALATIIFGSMGCVPGEVVHTFGDRSKEMNIRRAWSAELGSSVQRPVQLPWVVVRIPHRVNSNIVRIHDRLLFTEVRQPVSKAAFDERCPVWVTCRDVGSGKLLYRTPFRPGCELAGYYVYQLLALRDRLFIGHPEPEKPPYKGCIGVCWDWRSGQVLETSRLSQRQLPKDMDWLSPRWGRSLATDGQTLFIWGSQYEPSDRQQKLFYHFAALRVPKYDLVWHRRVELELPEKWGKKWVRPWFGPRFDLHYVNGVLLALASLSGSDSRGRAAESVVSVVALDPGAGDVLWRKQKQFSPVGDRWARSGRIVVAGRTLYVPTDDRVLEAWQAASGDKV